MSNLIKLADYITELSDHDLDQIWYDSEDDAGNPDYNKVYRNINRLLGRVQAGEYDYDNETAESVDKPTKVHDIIMQFYKKDPVTWYQWRQRARQALQDKDTQALDELTQPVGFYAKTDKPGIASDGWTTWDADTLEKSVNLAYGGWPTKELASLLVEYRKRYNAYQDAEKEVEKAKQNVNKVRGVTKSASEEKRADYIDTIPYGEEMEMNWAAEDAEPAVAGYGDDWDARYDRVQHRYHEALVNRMADIVKKIRKGDYSDGDAGTGVGEKGTNPEVFMPEYKWNDAAAEYKINMLPYDEWKIRADVTLKNNTDDINPDDILEGFYVKTDGSKLNSPAYRIDPKGAAEAVYGKTLPAGITKSIADIDAAEKALGEAEDRSRKAEDFVRKLLKLPKERF